MASLTTGPLSDLAASSSSTASWCASTSYSDYDVFINHRGPDVKNTFASHLYRCLRDHGLRVFLDKPELEEGQSIFSQIDHANRVASVHIAIFSKNYAQSSWCLDELVLMKESGATILPVFLNVKPSVVRHTGEHGEFAEALQKHQEKTTFDPRTGESKRRYDSDTIQKWRNALSDVADISGFDLKAFNGDEGELLDKVLQKVLKTVPRTPLDVAKYPTGLGEKLQEFEKAVLSQHEEERVKTEIVGIVGVGGVGKTTLAKEIFNCMGSCYNKSSFIFDVREKAARMSLNSVQSQLIKDLKGMDIKIDSTAQGIGILKRHLSSCHALIVLDDVDSADQLDVLLPIKHILSPQSLILVTSRDKHVLKSSGMLGSSIYNLGGLNTRHSKELFCSYAFYHSVPPPEFEDLVDLFVKPCDGLPLSLKVFGALVCGRNDRRYWEELLDQLHKTLPVEIQQRLRISYDKLHGEEQRLFLDIACYFIGEDRDLAIKLWGVVGLQNLEDKCLLEVDHGNKIKIIKMHDHMRDLGRNIEQDVSIHLRLWYYTTNTIDDWLEQSSSVTTEVHGIKTINRADRFYDTLTTRSSEMPWYRRWSDEVLGNCLRHLFNNFGRGGILNLQLVTTEAGYLETIMRRARSPNLIWLRWYDCPYSCLPSWIPMENLKVLEIAGGQLEILWKRQSQAPLKLRELNIIAPLSAFPKSIGQLKHLEKIIICRPYFHGITLESLPEEFCYLRSLKYLELKGCEKMMSLPDSFGKLTTLEHIDLTSASSLQKLPDSFGYLSRLKHLSFRNCSNLTISNRALGNITTLEFLNLSSCKKVKELPSQVARQRHLGELLLEGTDLKELPGGMGELCNLRVMTLGGDLFTENLLEELPPCLGYLKSLNDLSVTGSRKLTRLPESFGPSSPLKKLKLWKCGIEYLPQDFAKMKSLEILSVDKCPWLELPFRRVEGETGERQLDKLSSTDDDDNCMFGLRELWMSGTKILEAGFPVGICPNLQTLTLQSCSELRQISCFTGLGKLEFLEMIQCDKVKDLPSFEPLVSLKQLWVVGCDEIKSIEGLGKLTKLREIRVRKCHEIQELFGVEHIMSLKKLYIAGCPKLKWVNGVLEQLQIRLKQGFNVENKDGKDN